MAAGIARTPAEYSQLAMALLKKYSHSWRKFSKEMAWNISKGEDLGETSLFDPARQGALLFDNSAWVRRAECALRMLWEVQSLTGAPSSKGTHAAASITVRWHVIQTRTEMS